MSKLGTFLRLPKSRKWLLGWTFILSIYVYLLYRFFNSKARLLSSKYTLSEPVDNQRVRDISWAIRVVSKKVFWENVCRHQAYEAMVLCNFFRIPYKIFVGFKKNDRKEIEAHAWTTVNNQIITGFCIPEEYAIQAVY